jgi:hypothetical protein
VEELGRWCGRCGTELRSGARFCPRCGQRVIDEEPAADTPGLRGGTDAPAETESEVHSGPGFTEIGQQPAAAAPGSSEGFGLDAFLAAPPEASGQPSPAALSSSEPARVAPAAEIRSPAAATPPRDDWSDWYADTAPRTSFQPPANQPPFEQPRAQLPPEAPSWLLGPGGLFGPSGPGGPGGLGPGGPPGRDRRSRAPLFWSALSAAVVAAVVVSLVVLHPSSHHETANDAANSTGTANPASAVSARSPAASASVSASPSASASASSTAVTEHQAATTVAGMLASSVSDRTAIDDAYNDVDSCGPNLNGDAAVFTRAASSRRAMLASLDSMPGRSALPAALISDLANAWQASITADQGFAGWANDEVTQGCVRDDTLDPGYQATVTPDNEANQYKTAFVAQWNPIATSFGLTTYQQSQL